MSLYKAQAIILRVIKYNESDKIVNLLTAEGRIGAIAKGSRKTKSRFSGQVEPFCLVDLILYQGKNLHTITQASLINPHKNIRNDYDKFLMASAAAELVDKVTFSGQAEGVLFKVLKDFLKSLDTLDKANRLYLVKFDWLLLKTLGLFPSLESTVESGDIWFDLAEGKLYNKPTSQNSNLKVQALTIQLLKSIIKDRISDTCAKTTDKQLVDELTYLTEQYLKYQLQIKLKSRSYL